MKNWEQQLSKFIRDKGFTVEQHHKLKDKEIDIFLPELKIGLELNGAYFHNSHKDVGGKPLLYHYQKSELALKKHIHLYHLWSSSPARFNQSLISRILGLSTVYRKDITFKSISPEVAKVFLLKSAPLLYSRKQDKFYGAYRDGVLVAIGVFTKKSKQLMELRGLEFKNFCLLADSSIYALFKYVQKCLRCKIISTSIPRDIYPALENTFWSRLGFIQERIEKPLMFYYNFKTHKVYKRELFTKDQLKLRWADFEPSLNEEENCYRHNLVRCYDSGRIRATLRLKVFQGRLI